ncbi:glycosyltransferase [Nocardioides sp. MAHUQ-72]|uniref:glycosyltransferase n=1 Tax=unclassified Nocardioides TaxID=2615069 RepID=UPI0036158490
MPLEKRSPDVSVVVPTVGRPELVQALKSAREQVGVSVEVIVVFDLQADSSNARVSDGLADLVLYTGGGRRANVARNMGTRAASGRYVAFLDDDDFWAPGKLAGQVAVAGEIEALGRHALVSTRFGQLDVSTGHRFGGLPSRVYDGSITPEEYLFVRRRPGAGRATLPVPTLLVSRELACKVPWREDLRRHQDWDWLVRACAEPGTQLVQMEDDLVTVRVGSAGSISATADWASSLEWAVEALGAKPHVLVDFLAGQPLRYALQARSPQGVRRTVREMLRTARRPTVPSLLVGLSGLLTRTMLQQVMRRVR